MIWLSNSTLARLRDVLLTRGQRPSFVAPAQAVTMEIMEAMQSQAEYGPLCEAMYLMMSADGKITSSERDVLKGALRKLSGDALRGAQIEALVDAAAAKVREEGRERRMQDVARELHDDRARAEVAFVLAAAVAFADNAIADEENDTLNTLAEGLNIDESRADELLNAVEADMADGPTAN
jgi:uncharacterized tellurite resistance protein B-like protein